MPPKAGAKGKGKQAAKGKGKRRADSEDDSESDAPKAKAKKPRGGGKENGEGTALLVSKLSRAALEALALQSIDNRSALSRGDVEDLLDPAVRKVACLFASPQRSLVIARAATVTRTASHVAVCLSPSSRLQSHRTFAVALRGRI